MSEKFDKRQSGGGGSKIMRSVIFWAIWNIPMPAWLAPRLLGIALGSKPQKVMSQKGDAHQLDRNMKRET